MRWMMLAVLVVVRLAMGYQFQSIASVSTQLVEQFGFSYAQVGTLIGLFLLPGVFLSIPSGLLTRAASDKTLLMAGAALMAAGSALIAIAEIPAIVYVGRLLTGVGGTIFSLILTKMVTEWFLGKEIITALSIMLVSWPVGIALGLMTQGAIADAFGWPVVMGVCTAVALAALVLTGAIYRAPSGQAAVSDSGPLRIGLPVREAIHMSVAGLAWAAFNASLILLVSFGPDALVDQAWSRAEAQSAASLMMWATIISLPLGGRLMEKFGHVTAGTTVCLILAAGASFLLALGWAPAAMFILVGLAGGVPAGALIALTSEAVSPANRGPGLGIYYTWYYLGMTLAPAVAGWLRDALQDPGAPLVLAAALLFGTVAMVLVLRLLQVRWPIRDLGIA